MNYTKMEKQAANKAAKMITEPVIEIHLTSKRISGSAICFHSIFEPLNRQAHFLE
jgi:hypothetical protein